MNLLNYQNRDIEDLKVSSELSKEELAFEIADKDNFLKEIIELKF